LKINLNKLDLNYHYVNYKKLQLSKNLERIILVFIKNRKSQNESTAARHIHRRFDISMNDSENILEKLTEIKVIEKYYDNDYQENRYRVIE
jgi:hypothetical protein